MPVIDRNFSKIAREHDQQIAHWFFVLFFSTLASENHALNVFIGTLL